MSTRESRVLAFDSEIRMTTSADGKRTLVSTAPPWDTLSVPMRMFDGRTFREKFERGAFGDLAGSDIIATFQHDDSLLLGRTPSTLRLTDGDDGLRYEVDLGDTTIARDVAEHVSRRDVRGSSFEFSLRGNPSSPGDTWEEQEDGTWVRTVRAAKLYQVGPVTHPAYESGTDVALRSLREFEQAHPVGTPRLDRAKRMLRLVELA